MSSELELLRQRISELETKNAKLEIEARNLEAMAEIVNLRAELKSRIEELEKSRTDTAVENTRRDDIVEELEQKIEARFALLEEGSDLVIAQLNKCKTPQIEEVTTKVGHQGRMLEDRKTDAFLDEVHKKKVSDEIRQRKREKKLQEREPDSETLIASLDSDTSLNEKNRQDCSPVANEQVPINQKIPYELSAY